MAGFVYVAAIDFGTTYTGYAFSSRDDFKENPTKVSAKRWNATEGQLVSQKAPTTVVLGPEGKFEDFGYDAENKYFELAEDGDHKDYYYFSRFKMMLYDKDGKIKLTRETKLKDVRGRERTALEVFSHAIKYQKDYMLDENKTRGTTIKEEEILWVLTVPAIWDDAAKQFMTEAAEIAGIPEDRLEIALEPEAASLYCRHVNVQLKNDGQDNDLEAFSPGRQYIVLDAGGGTVDITVHEVQQNGTLKELERASGGDWGGTRVDKAFIGMLEEITGKDFMDQYRKDRTADYMQLLRHFEVKKRSDEKRKDQSLNKVTIQVPGSLQETFDERNKVNLNERTKDTKYQGKLYWKGDKIRIDLNLFQSFFDPACNETVKHLETLLQLPRVKNAKTILMVGGFSESPILQERIKTAFPECRVIIPQDPGLAVLKGAVIFGHDPDAITERIAHYTYGIRISEHFDPAVHPADKKVRISGVDYCENVFDKYVDRGESVKLNEVRESQTYVPLYPGQTTMNLYVFTSEEKPRYTDNCRLMGSVIVDLSKLSIKSEKKVKARLKFGGTKLKVEGKVIDTGEITKGSYDFLGGKL